MPNNCASCDHAQVREINHRLREERSLNDISRWLGGLGTPITRQALARHRDAHLNVPSPGPGRKPLSGNFYEKVVASVEQDMDDGLIRPKVPDAIAAQVALDRRDQQKADRDMVARWTLVLTGNVPHVRVLSPEDEAMEAEFKLLESG